MSDLFSDSRFHGYQGPSRNVRLQRVATAGGGSISKSPDGKRCAVTGKESLRVVRLSDPSEPHSQDHKSSVGRGGHRIDCSRNLWDGSGLKIDSASTDVAWAHGSFTNKILTSARNGELIMWDLNKSGSTKYGTHEAIIKPTTPQHTLQKDVQRTIYALSINFLFLR